MEGDGATAALADDAWLIAHPPSDGVLLFGMPVNGYYTVEDWLGLPEVAERIELIGGCYLVSPMPSSDQTLCASRLRQLLLEAAPPGYEVVETGKLLVGEDGFIADVIVGRAAATGADAVAFPASDIACVVDIVTPGKSSHQRGYEIKPPSYAASGIPVFIRVELMDDGTPRVEVFHLGSQGYELAAGAKAGDRLTTDLPYPLSFDPATLAGL